ncbi:Hypothetical predicted protein [Mytilus galloprovincialis]|uniref:Uncharacterized protein n=1 Tax=Mytilus galloprovincialis TaxID=29158 RepID=A0A8B6BHR1_MYTGA|nr:Hypothetical predicted protein [Mytilus galloprovincialis]
MSMQRKKCFPKLSRLRKEPVGLAFGCRVFDARSRCTKEECTSQGGETGDKMNSNVSK